MEGGSLILVMYLSAHQCDSRLGSRKDNDAADDTHRYLDEETRDWIGRIC